MSRMKETSDYLPGQPPRDRPRVRPGAGRRRGGARRDPPGTAVPDAQDAVNAVDHEYVDQIEPDGEG
ncbi:hypothetical protein [Salana multivorans]